MVLAVGVWSWHTWCKKLMDFPIRSTCGGCACHLCPITSPHTVHTSHHPTSLTPHCHLTSPPVPLQSQFQGPAESAGDLSHTQLAWAQCAALQRVPKPYQEWPQRTTSGVSPEHHSI